MSNEAVLERKKRLEENIGSSFADSYEKRLRIWKENSPSDFETIVLEHLPKQCSLTEMKQYITEMKAAYRDKLSLHPKLQDVLRKGKPSEEEPEELPEEVIA